MTRIRTSHLPDASKEAWRSYDTNWRVHKFGGASLETAPLYKTCGDLLVSQSQGDSGKTGSVPTAAVVSACGGMTDALVTLVNAAIDDLQVAKTKLEAAAKRQTDIILSLVPNRPDLTAPLIENLEKDQVGVMSMLTAASLMNGVPPQMMEMVAGLGEVWSAQTLAAYLKSIDVECGWIDARDVLIVADAGSSSGLGEKGTAMDTIEPFWEETGQRLQRWWEASYPEKAKHAPFLIITGFVCSTPSGRPTTLKRSGSDYSATIFAKVLGASSVTMWKNVNGVYTADPRRVPEAFPIANMTFDEAMELAYFGGQVLHPSAMVPCMKDRIPVLVKNVFNPTHPGTRVYGRGDTHLRWEDQANEDEDESMPVKAITSIEKVSLVTLSGAAFLGTPGVAKRMMEAMSSAGVNVILASQGSSEHSITVAVAENDGETALESVRSAFELEIVRNEETMASLRNGLSILAVIGEGMKNVVGVSGRFFHSLGQAKVNIVAIAQGSSQRNISVVVDRADLSRALRAAHTGFHLSSMTMAVAIVGTGNVGTELMRLLARFKTNVKRNNSVPAMKEMSFLNIETRGVCDKNMMLTAEGGLPLEMVDAGICSDGSGGSFFDIEAWEKSWTSKGATITEAMKEFDRSGGNEFHLDKTDIDAMMKFLDTRRTPHKVVIDCTATEEIADMYPQWLSQGIHVISPNKRAGAGPLKRYHECITEQCRLGAGAWNYESCFGAQMPVISLIHDLLQTGDVVTSISGVFSASLSAVFNDMFNNPDKRFSEAVAEIQASGLTEPNPRDDLLGKDTARKALIVARELGMQLEISDVQIEPLLPEAVSSPAKHEPLERLLSYLQDNVDAQIAEKMKAAKDKGERLLYVGEVDVAAGTIKVGLKSFPIVNPPFTVAQGETVVQIFSERYSAPTPLTVKGPGAGAKVTASGVFASLLRLAKTLS
eukprot:TRINITY_DN26112_c0_g2_i1.p1 TRINITY_DN26112_c0_g2~~TRINITY_DN26112_c0_g2_i1.p1  ORF type:complete len:939 (-),score=174.08 TRINITY_DN26112_c0_g2_i1:194-3010(-)